jgi:hypothetical protein
MTKKPCVFPSSLGVERGVSICLIPVTSCNLTYIYVSLMFVRFIFRRTENGSWTIGYPKVSFNIVSHLGERLLCLQPRGMVVGKYVDYHAFNEATIKKETCLISRMELSCYPRLISSLSILKFVREHIIKKNAFSTKYGHKGIANIKLCLLD